MSLPVLVVSSVISVRAPKVRPVAVNPWEPHVTVSDGPDVNATTISPGEIAPAYAAHDAEYPVPEEVSCPVNASQVKPVVAVQRTATPVDEFPEVIATDREPDSEPVAIFANTTVRVGPVSLPFVPVVPTDSASLYQPPPHPVGRAMLAVAPGFVFT